MPRIRCTGSALASATTSPCCTTCCELLFSEAGLLSELDGPPPAGTVHANRYDVALDVQSGIVVHLEPVGGVRTDLAFTNTIHEVDADLDDHFA